MGVRLGVGGGAALAGPVMLCLSSAVSWWLTRHCCVGEAHSVMEPWILRGMAGTLLIPNSTMSSALAGLHGAQGGKDGPPSLACMPHPGAKGTS